MNGFWITFDLLPEATARDPTPLRISVGNTVLTRLLRDQGSHPDDALLAAPAPLAFWLADNWWRLRWESLPPAGPSARWRLAHELTAVGGGFAWPRLLLWGDVDRVSVQCRADPPGVVGPVRFLTEERAWVDAVDFEESIDHFLDQVLAAPWDGHGDHQALQALVEALRSERANPDTARWRRIEARLGYDPDQGSEALITAINDLAMAYGLEAVEEAISAKPGTDTAAVLEQEIQAARATGLHCHFAALLTDLPPVDRLASEQPWMLAERSAQQVRLRGGVQSGPIKNKALADLLGVPARALRQTTGGPALDYGLRVGEGGTQGAQRVALRPKWPEGRRFDLCRALGDAVWARDDLLGPIADTSTSRQQFQRAFAQSLLCPFDDLLAYLKSDCPDDEDIAAAAKHFHVNPWVVENLLINKDMIDRSRLANRLEVADAPSFWG